MKTFIRTAIGFILMLSFFALLGQAQDKDAVKKANEANDAKADEDIVNDKVADFLVAAADARMMDAKEGELAITKGTTTAIQNYGQTMVKDQALMLQKIRVLAAKRNISLPSSISSEKQEGYHELASKQGQEFDDKFIKMMIIDHKRDVKLFEKATDLEDAEVRAFAKDFLPMIEGHLETINNIKEASRASLR